MLHGARASAASSGRWRDSIARIEADEARSVFDALRNVAIAAGFGWVVGEVELEIASGRPPERRQRSGRRVELPSIPLEELPSGLHRQRVRSETYSSQEQLALLISGLRRATVDAFAFEDALAKFAEGVDGKSVRFEDEINQPQTARARRVTRPLVDATRDTVATLAGLLANLERRLWQ